MPDTRGIRVRAEIGSYQPYPMSAPSSTTYYVSRFSIYQRRRKRQQRLCLVVIALLFLMAASALAIWGACQAATRFFIPLPVHAHQFERYMDKEFGLFNTPSLLYQPNLDYALATRHMPGVFSNKLLPIMPASEDHALKKQLESLFAAYPAGRFKPRLYFYNPQDASFVEINGYTPTSAASVIKLPILLDYLLSLDENVMTLDTPLLYADFHRAGGAGELQYRPSGQDFPANSVASQMIRISDNTCTNMMIAYLGGTDAVNRKLAALGLLHTRIRNWLPDLEGTNTITPYEMATILYNIDQGYLLSNATRENGLSILESTHNRHLLVSPLPPEVRVAHKTGDIGTSLGDSGVVYLPDGRRYVISIQVERPYNDYTARDMIQKASRMIYDHLAAQPAPEIEPEADSSI